MDEIHLWQWRYTDDFGKRRIFPCRLTAEDARHVLAGRHYECAWELFRFGHFKGLDHEAAARSLAAWAHKQGIEIAFDVRRVRDADVHLRAAFSE